MENPTGPPPAPAGIAPTMHPAMQGHRQLLALPPSTTTATNHASQTTVIDFVALPNTITTSTHPAENLYWINIADMDGMAPPRDRNGDGGRHWPCLFYENGYDDAIRDVDRSQTGFLSKLHQEKLKERNRNKFLASTNMGNSSANAAPPSSRPVFILLGVTPHRAIPLPDIIQTKSQAQSEGIIIDYWEGHDTVQALRGFPNPQIMEAAQGANFDAVIPNTNPPITQFDRAFQFAAQIINHSAALHDDTPSEEYGSVFDNFRTAGNTTIRGHVMALPPSTAPAASASAPGTNGTATRTTTNHIAAVSTAQRGPTNAHAHHGQQPFISPVPFALGAPAAMMVDDGPTEEQGRALDAMMGDDGAPTAIMGNGPTEEQARVLDAFMGGGGGPPPAQDRSGSEKADNSPPGDETHIPAPGRVSISPQVQVFGGTLADDVKEVEEYKEEDGMRIDQECEEQDEEMQEQGQYEHEDEDEVQGEESDADDDDEDEKADVTPAKLKKSTDNDRTEDDLPDNIESPIQRKDPWPLVLPKLKASGWKYKPPPGSLDLRWTYFRPGRINKPDAVEGVDFFHGEMAVKDYIRAAYGWRGGPGDFDEEDLLELNPRHRRNRGQNKNVYSPSSKTAGAVEEQTKNSKKVGKAKTAKKASANKKIVPQKTPASKKKTSSTSSVAVTPAPTIDPSAPKIKGTPIFRADDWVTVWDKLEYTGWKRDFGTGLMTDYFYILPHAAEWWKKANKGVEGVDYFTNVEAVRAYCSKKYGWDPEGADKARMKQEADAERKAADAEASRKAKEAASEQKRQQKEAASEQKRQQKEAKRLAKQALAEARRKAKEAAKKEKSAAPKRKYARMKEKDLDQFHHEPGKRSNKSPTGRIWGKEKKSPKKKRAQTGSESPSTPTIRTKPQDPGKPRLSDSPVSSRSLSPDDKGFYDWSNLWPRLKVTGWTYTQGRGLASWLYVRPNRNPHDKNAQQGVDFFDSEDAVIEYCRQADIDEGEVKKIPSGAPKSGKKRSSPTKTEQSGVTGDFDMEAITSPPASSRTPPKKKTKVDSIWWKTHPVPSSMTAWRILNKKLGFRYSAGVYRTPDSPKKGGEANVDFFDDIENLRALLCKTGIPNLTSAELIEDERDTMKRWVATANTPLGLDEKTSVHVLQDVPIYSDTDAWTLLKYRLDWTEMTVAGETRYHKPGAQDNKEASRGEDYFLSLSEVQDYLRAQGPFDRRFNYKWCDIKTPSKGKGREAPNEIPAFEYLALTFWAARSPIPVHHGNEEGKASGATSTSTAKNQKPTAMNESPSASSSSSSASSPSSTFGPYEGSEQVNEEEEVNGGKARATSSALGGFVSKLAGHFIPGHKEKESPGEDMVEDDAPTTPDEKTRREDIIKDSQNKMQNLPDSPAKAADSWPIFWNKMVLAGWELARCHDGASRDVYYPPIAKGRKSGSEKGVDGVDYITSEEGVRQYAVDHLGWGGHHDDIHNGETILETFATPAPEICAQDAPIDELEGETRKKALINLAIKKMDEIQKKTPGASPVQHGDNWLNVKTKMIHSGWEFYCRGAPRDLVVDFVVLLPGGRKPAKGGKLGIDYLLNDDDAKQFAIDHFDWCGIFDGIDAHERT